MGNHNSGRRPRHIEDRMRLGKLYPKAIDVMEHLLEDSETPANILVDIAKYISDQHLGKAKQVQEISGANGGPIEQHTRITIDPGTLGSALAILRDAGGIRVGTTGKPDASMVGLHTPTTHT